MGTTVNRELFLQHLESVQPGLSPKEIVEQSTCFVFSDKKVMTYNGEIACRQDSLLNIKGAVQAAPLLSILRKLPDKEVSIELGGDEEGAEFLIHGKRRHSGIRMERDILLPIDTDVTLPKKKDWKELHSDFADAIQIVHQCAGTNQAEEIFTGVHIHPKWVEACDNTQMSRYRLKTRVSSSMLIKRDSIKHIIPLGMTKFCETDGFLHFSNPQGLVVSCRRMALEEYKNLSPIFKITGQPVTLPKSLTEAVDRADVFSAENADDNEVHVSISPERLKIQGIGVSGWYREQKKIKYKGQPIAFVIAPQLLIELVKRHNECEISNDCLKVNGGKFVYITCLETSKEK